MVAAFFKKEAHVRAGVFLVLSILGILGFWLRIHNLGELGLVIDEGLQALAVQGILKHGVPMTDSGLIYTRGLSFLYIQAAAARLFELNEFWLRFPSVLFGVATIFPSYILGKTLFNRGVGLLTAAIMTFSVWEIELSRVARFYTAFQFMYLVSLICFYHGFMLDKLKDKIWFFVVAFITFSTHTLSRMLITFFAIPWLSSTFSFSRKLIYGFWAVCLYGLIILYDKLIRLLNTLGDQPPPVVLSSAAVSGTFEKIRSAIHIPFPNPLDLSYFMKMPHEDPFLFTGLALLIGGATVYHIYRAFRIDNNIWQNLIAISMVWASFIHQFGLVLIIFAIYLAFFARDIRSLWTPTIKMFYGAAACCFIFWLLIIANDPAVTLGKIIVTMFGYPNFIRYFLYRFVMGWPIMTIVLGVGSIMLLARYISERNDPVTLFVLGAIFIPLVLTSFFHRSPESRYFFHLYPVIVLVFSMVAIKAGSHIIKKLSLNSRWTRGLAVGALILATLFISQDANPFHAWNVGNTNYGSVKDPIRSFTNFIPYGRFHQDLKTPSLYVRERLMPGDRVVVFGPIFMSQIFHFYIGKVDYIVNLNLAVAKKISKRKLISYVTGSEILYSVPKIKQLIEKSPGGVWLLGDRSTLCRGTCHGYVGCGGEIMGNCWHFYHKPIRDYLRSLAHNPDYVGLDGKTFVVKVR